MSCTLLTPPYPTDGLQPVCTAASLRLIEHYELDYYLAPDAAGDPPQDGEHVAARRWNTYYCATCHADFGSHLLAFAHTGEVQGAVEQAPPTMKAVCRIDDVRIKLRDVSHDDYSVDDEGELVELQDEDVREMDVLDLPYLCRIHDIEFAIWEQVRRHLEQHNQETTL